MSNATLAPGWAAIVDLDGTLVDTLGDFVVALNATLSDLDLPPVQAEQVRRLVGKGSEHLLRSVLGLSQDAESVQRLIEPAWQRYQQHYLRINGEHAELFAGAREGLQRLQDAGWPLACLTNKPLAFAQPLLERKGLLRYFSHVFGGDSFGRKKPDPLPLLKTCAALAREPAHTLMIGDSSNDARAARAAGCPVVLMTYGYNHGEPVHTVDADGFLDRMDALRWPPAAR